MLEEFHRRCEGVVALVGGRLGHFPTNVREKENILRALLCHPMETLLPTPSRPRECIRKRFRKRG